MAGNRNRNRNNRSGSNRGNRSGNRSTGSSQGNRNGNRQSGSNQNNRYQYGSSPNNPRNQIRRSPFSSGSSGGQVSGGQLVKAKLCPAMGEGGSQITFVQGFLGFNRPKRIPGKAVNEIEFQFNPTEISFSREVELNSNTEGRTRSGVKKISFAGPAPITLSIGNATFDTYEEGVSVKKKYTDQLMKALDFTQYQANVNGYRPPIYVFTWGDNRYLRCFVKSLTLKFTLFLPDGTPVRATADLKLQQVEKDGITRPKEN
ncbi:MAG: hypothetical protein AAFR31_14985 [Cyanobacteria bacterium J06627_8]